MNTRKLGLLAKIQMSGARGLTSGVSCMVPRMA